MTIKSIKAYFRYQDPYTGYFMDTYEINVEIYQYYIEFINKVKHIYISGKLIYDENYCLLYNKMVNKLKKIKQRENNLGYGIQGSTNRKGEFIFETHLDNIKMLPKEKNQLLIEMYGYFHNPVLRIVLPDPSDHNGKWEFDETFIFNYRK